MYYYFYYNYNREVLERGPKRRPAGGWLGCLCARTPAVVLCMDRKCEIRGDQASFVCALCQYVVCEGCCLGNPPAAPPEKAKPAKEQAKVSSGVGSQSSALPRRVASAEDDFGLGLDDLATGRWRACLEAAEGAAGAEGKRELTTAAREVARHLRFLQLTVLSQEEVLEKKKKGSRGQRGYGGLFGGAASKGADPKEGCLEAYTYMYIHIYIYIYIHKKRDNIDRYT